MPAPRPRLPGSGGQRSCIWPSRGQAAARASGRGGQKALLREMWGVKPLRLTGVLGVQWRERGQGHRRTATPRKDKAAGPRALLWPSPTFSCHVCGSAPRIRSKTPICEQHLVSPRLQPHRPWPQGPQGALRTPAEAQGMCLVGTEGADLQTLRLPSECAGCDSRVNVTGPPQPPCPRGGSLPLPPRRGQSAGPTGISANEVPRRAGAGGPMSTRAPGALSPDTVRVIPGLTGYGSHSFFCQDWRLWASSA